MEQRESESDVLRRSILVSNLHEAVTNEELNEMFSTVGKLNRCGIN